MDGSKKPMFSQSLPEMILTHDLQSARLVRQHRAISVNALPHAMRRWLAGTKKMPRTMVSCGASVNKGRLCAAALCLQANYMRVMSRSFVSGRKIRPMTKLIAATTIGYQSPE
jgi:hypothetical protein